ncbi:MAG: type II toxin-antitoxin system Phd/YefM family antitoxin [Candidatus Daviesbacteria bacterium]|nr:type II toxin-antitoxin system Phd/YefM family antitoxin [Candidatus Daviesbacteria bacterium]
MITVSATTARNTLYDLLEEASSGKKIAITNKGETKAVLISPEELASWEATLEVMSDPKLVKSIKNGLDDIKHGRVIPWKEVKKELNIK